MIACFAAETPSRSHAQSRNILIEPFASFKVSTENTHQRKKRKSSPPSQKEQAEEDSNKADLALMLLSMIGFRFPPKHQTESRSLSTCSHGCLKLAMFKLWSQRLM